MHGLAKKSQGGKLSIRFTLENDYLICIIEDNGIGRKKSEELKLSLQNKNHKSFAMNATNERIEAINKSQSRFIQYEMIDIEDEENQGTGTKIILKFPQHKTSDIDY